MVTLLCPENDHDYSSVVRHLFDGIIFNSLLIVWAFCTNWSHGIKSTILDGKKAWHLPLGHRKQRKVKFDRLEFLCVRICYILLPSSMVEFAQCDQLVEKGRQECPRGFFH